MEEGIGQHVGVYASDAGELWRLCILRPCSCLLLRPVSVCKRWPWKLWMSHGSTRLAVATPAHVIDPLASGTLLGTARSSG